MDKQTGVSTWQITIYQLKQMQNNFSECKKPDQKKADSIHMM